MGKHILAVIALVFVMADARADEAHIWEQRIAEARALTSAGHHELAAKALQETTNYTDSHVETLGRARLAVTLHLYGHACYAANRFDDATNAFERAIQLLRVDRPGSVELSSTLSSLSAALAERKDYVRAEAPAREALAITEATDAKSAEAVKHGYNYGYILFKLGKNADAITRLRRAESIGASLFAGDDPNLRRIRDALAEAEAGAQGTSAPELKMASAAATHESLIEKFATLAQAGEVDELLSLFDPKVLASNGREAARAVLAGDTVAFFREYERMSGYEHVTNAGTTDGRAGLWHYTFIESRKGKLSPFQIAIINTAEGPRVLHIAVGECTRDRHPRVGPCK
jgi:tetratricopeptide (TPR) repeat protein